MRGSHAAPDAAAFYPTPELAAIADIPRQFARVLSIEVRERVAVALVEENDPPVVHWSVELLRRYEEGWQIHSNIGGLLSPGSTSWWIRHPDAEIARGIEIELYLPDEMNEAGSLSEFATQEPQQSYRMRVDWDST